MTAIRAVFMGLICSIWIATTVFIAWLVLR
jgi:hypothetical protein